MTKLEYSSSGALEAVQLIGVSNLEHSAFQICLRRRKRSLGRGGTNLSRKIGASVVISNILRQSRLEAEQVGIR